MIDLEKEALITLGAAARLIPRHRGTGKVNTQTLVWWIIRGKQGIYLEAYRQPGAWLTTVPAVQRFLSALADLERQRLEPVPPKPRKKSWAREYLEKQGVVDKQEAGT